MEIGFFGVEPWQQKVFKKIFLNDKLYFSKHKLTSAEAKKYSSLEVLSIFVHSKIDEKILEKLPRLKYIATRSAGFDHIDLEACKKRGIKVSNVPAYDVNTVAEQAFALMVCMSRKIVDSVERVRTKSYDLNGLKGFDLNGKTLGVVGTGNTGRYMVKIGRGLGMKVIAFDIVPDNKFAKETGMKYVTMEKLFSSSDIVSLHVPYNKHTYHLVNKKIFSLMKKGSYLINTSRGAVVDTLAMYQALKSGQLAGTGLDVLEEESALIELFHRKKGEHWKEADKKVLTVNLALIKMKNVFITPHNAFNTTEAINRILDATVKNIKGFKNKRSVNLVF
ncbi:MAG: hydroxyacid dehydrogenase [Nanoarchaeota archaeon]|nr:hydroxyacid dehydrogenase [Nanoarchaeota archaeon]MBU1644019.1 hydroxyacid dehydrogenase [Nanoarchaeota archaeon]MBU1976914.1 hydroxyacid dehydrogenase [Nanoarchaeota archaeon]